MTQFNSIYVLGDDQDSDIERGDLLESNPDGLVFQYDKEQGSYDAHFIVNGKEVVVTVEDALIEKNIHEKLSRLKSNHETNNDSNDINQIELILKMEIANQIEQISDNARYKSSKRGQEKLASLTSASHFLTQPPKDKQLTSESEILKVPESQKSKEFPALLEKKIPPGQRWFIDVAKLIYPVAEQDEMGWCLGVSGAALISIYGGGFGLLKLSQDPTSMSHDDLKKLLKSHDGCIQYKNKIYYYNQKEISEISNPEELLSIFEKLPMDQLCMASQENFDLIKSLAGVPTTTRFQLFHNVFQHNLRRLNDYSEELKRISTLPKNNAKEQRDKLAEKLKMDYPVRAFLETIMLITNPKIHAQEMLAEQSDQLANLPRQILRDDLSKSSNYLRPILALLDPDSEMREVIDVLPIGFYSRDDLTELFYSFSETLRSELKSKSLNYPISLVIGSTDHVMVVSIDPNQENQIIIRPNNLNDQIRALKDIPVVSVASEFFLMTNERKALDIRIYTHADDLEFTKECMLKWSNSTEFTELHKRGYQAQDKRKGDCFYQALNSDNDAALKNLLKGGFDPNYPLDLRDKNLLGVSFLSPLEFAIRFKKYNGVKILLSSPLVKPDNNQLSQAIRHNDMELVKILIESKKFNLNNVNLRYDEVSTFLMSAIDAKNLEMVQYLIEQGADVNYCDPLMNDTVLNYALSQNANEGIVKLLLDNGAKVYDKNSINMSQYSKELIESLSDFGNKAKLEHLEERKELQGILEFNRSIQYLLEGNAIPNVGELYKKEKPFSIYGALYCAREAEKDIGKLDDDDYKFFYGDEWEAEYKKEEGKYSAKRNANLDKLLEFLEKDETRFNEFKSRTGVLFNKDIMTDNMYNYVKSKIIAAQIVPGFFKPITPEEKLQQRGPEFKPPTQ